MWLQCCVAGNIFHVDLRIREPLFKFAPGVFANRFTGKFSQRILNFFNVIFRGQLLTSHTYDRCIRMQQPCFFELV